MSVDMSIDMSIDNQFQVPSEDESKKMPNIVYNENGNGNINLITYFPEYVELCSAIERGESWYDIMYPRIQDNTVDNSNKFQTGKKRKQTQMQQIDNNNISRDSKKPRYN